MQYILYMSTYQPYLMTGHPLLGPSVIEAIYSGCVYINPIYSPSPLLGRFASQHPYAADKIGVCV